MEYKFKRQRIDKISPEKIKEELKRIAKIHDFYEFGYREFDEIPDKLCTSGTVKNTFGSWKKALESLDIKLKKRSKRKYSDLDLFEEMERIWSLVGHRPSRAEWENSKPNISYGTYKHTFNSWTSACLKYIEYKMGGEIEVFEKPEIENNSNSSYETIPPLERRRNIPLGLRLKVMERDNFRCVYCGRSPATDSVKIHIDHITPFSKGGKTVLENLQTLCDECNLGKSNNEVRV